MSVLAVLSLDELLRDGVRIATVEDDRSARGSIWFCCGEQCTWSRRLRLDFLAELFSKALTAFRLWLFVNKKGLTILIWNKFLHRSLQLILVNASSAFSCWSVLRESWLKI